jgi:hypothetical protein
MSGAINPYAPPKAQVDDVTPFLGEADAIRREHIQREASIRSIGVLYYFGGGALCLASVAVMVGFGLSGNRMSGLPLAGLGVFILALGVFSIFVGRGIRKLRPWARITAIVMAILGLLRPPAGTLINIYILYLLFSEKGRRIFESDYPEIVAATPDVKYKTSVVVWVVLGILVLLILAGLGAALVARR